MPMTADDVGRLREERRGDDWSARSARSGGMEGVDSLAVARMRDLLVGVDGPGPESLLGGRTRSWSKTWAW